MSLSTDLMSTDKNLIRVIWRIWDFVHNKSEIKRFQSTLLQCTSHKKSLIIRVNIRVLFI